MLWLCCVLQSQAFTGSSKNLYLSLLFQQNPSTAKFRLTPLYLPTLPSSSIWKRHWIATGAKSNSNWLQLWCDAVDQRRWYKCMGESHQVFVFGLPHILIIHKVYGITASHYEICSYAFDASY